MEQFLIQLLGIIGMVLNFASYQCKNTKHLYLFQSVSGFFFALNFYFLDAYTGSLLNALNIVRGCLFAYCQSEKVKKYSSIGLMIAFIAAGISTYSGFSSVIATVAQVAGTITMSTKNGKIIRLGQLFGISPLWLIHNILCFSIGGILTESFAIVSVLIFITRFGWKNFIHAKTI
ncbi:MAG: YgjV family protein [Ruminococcaceae bacterium]|nr:YgjV family protein [Oscillospiraceae bacterium]